MQKRILTYIILLFAAFFAVADDFSPEMMPNVNKANRFEFVSDPGNLLSPATKEKLNQLLWNLRQQTSVEAVVAIPPSIGDTPIEDWSEQLFTSWGIGKSDKDNGVLFVLAPEQKRVRIQTGYGVEGALPDIACKNIINRAVIPNMKEGNLDAAVSQAVTLMASALSDPAVADELRSSQKDNYGGEVNSLSSEEFWQFIQYIAAFVFLAGLIYLLIIVFSTRKLDPYQRAVKYKQAILVFAIATVFSLGSALILLAIDYLLYRRCRTKRRRCPRCNAKMNRLGEEEDNQLLSDSQDFEERINTVDYDVWECPQCGMVERFPFKIEQRKYTECPFCHTIAMCEVENRTLRPATTRSAGQGEKIYECQYCHKQKREPFVIPMKESVAPLIAGAAIGSMSGRGGGGGGFGGGFGGGSTGGGGASGGW